MRILHLVSCRGWSSDAYWAARMSAELERAGHQVTLVCKRGTDRRVIERCREAGAGRIDTLALGSGLRPAGDWGDLRTLLRWLPGADVVHVHRGKEHWLAALANRLSATPRPLVRTRHIVQPIRPHALNRWLYREATDLVVTVTEAIRRQYVAAHLLPPERVVALPGGVDRTRFHPGVDGGAFRRALRLPPDIPLIGLVSRFRVMKGHHVAVKAAALLAASGRPFRMVFIGQGTTEPAVRRAIAAAGLDPAVSVAGFVADLAGAMAAFDLALYPALESDGMSRVLFEYLASGLPVLASRVGVVPEVLVHDETALLVPAGEPAALAQAMGRLCEDAGLRSRLGGAAARLVESRLSGAQVAARLGSLYSGLAGRGPGPRG